MPYVNKHLKELAEKKSPVVKIVSLSDTINSELYGRPVSYRYARLDCGHSLNMHEPVFKTDYTRCPKCGMKNAKKFIAENPDAPKSRTHKDGRPKPKFRTPEGEKKFLARLAASRAANSIDRLRKP